MDEQGNTHICQSPPASVLAVEDELAAPTYLIVLRGGIPGSMLPVDMGENWLGRAVDNAIQLADATVSRHHALLEIGPDGRVRLTDHHSSNGTYVNNRRLRPNVPVELNDGDRFASARWSS